MINIFIGLTNIKFLSIGTMKIIKFVLLSHLKHVIQNK